MTYEDDEKRVKVIYDKYDLQSAAEELAESIRQSPSDPTSDERAAHAIREWAIMVQESTGRGVAVTVVGSSIVAWFTTPRPQEPKF